MKMVSPPLPLALLQPNSAVIGLAGVWGLDHVWLESPLCPSIRTAGVGVRAAGEVVKIRGPVRRSEEDFWGVSPPGRGVDLRLRLIRPVIRTVSGSLPHTPCLLICRHTSARGSFKVNGQAARPRKDIDRPVRH